MPLSDAAIRNAKPGQKPIKLSDAGGLQLHVSTAGGKVFYLAYRHAGKQMKIRVGGYPETSLAEARAARDAARKLIDKGIDPIAHARAQQEAAEASTTAATTTFRVIADELLAKKVMEQKAANTISKLTWLLDLACEDLGDKPVTAIRPAEVLAMLRKLEARGHRETAKRMRSLVSECFRYAISTDRCEIDPAAPLVGALAAPIVRHRPAITDPVEFGGMLRAIDGFSGQRTTRDALKLLALLAPRPGELRAAEWVEIDFQQAVWTIPASRAKQRREHRVPLPRQALQILEELKEITGKGPLVLPGVGMSGGVGRRIAPRPLSENTLNGALKRLGIDENTHCPHGFRSSFSTMANETAQFAPDVIEAALAHVDPNGVRRAYARGTYWQERVRLATWWADEVDRMRLLKPSRS